MSFYKNPEEMYTARAERFRRDGNTHWAQAKNGEGGHHYTQARIAYVGETNDLRRRMGEHLHHGKLAQPETRGGTLEWKTADGRSTSRTRRQHEQAKIARHDPPLNRSIGGEGRIAARKKK